MRERVRREQAKRERDELLEALRGTRERPLRSREDEERGEAPPPDTGTSPLVVVTVVRSIGGMRRR